MWAAVVAFGDMLGFLYMGHGLTYIQQKDYGTKAPKPYGAKRPWSQGPRPWSQRDVGSGKASLPFGKAPADILASPMHCFMQIQNMM